MQAIVLASDGRMYLKCSQRSFPDSDQAHGFAPILAHPAETQRPAPSPQENTFAVIKLMQKDENMKNLCLIGIVVAERAVYQWEDQWLLQSVCWSIFGHDNEPQFDWVRLVVKRALSAQLE